MQKLSDEPAKLIDEHESKLMVSRNLLNRNHQTRQKKFRDRKQPTGLGFIQLIFREDKNDEQS